MNKIKSILTIHNLLVSLWALGVVFLISILVSIICGYTISDETAKLLAPAGIILASFIASASLMKSIHANKELQALDKRNEIMSYLSFMIHISNEVQEKYIEIVDIKSLKSSPYTNTTMFSKLEKILPKISILWDKLLVDKYFLLLGDEGYIYFNKVSSNIRNLETVLNRFNSSGVMPLDREVTRHNIDREVSQLLSILETKKKELDYTYVMQQGIIIGTEKKEK